MRWKLSGAVEGTAEVWLDEFGDGTVVHTYLRGEPASGGPRKRWRRERWVRRRYALPLKRHLTAVKDALEAEHVPGLPRVPLSQRVVSPPIQNATPPVRPDTGRGSDEGDTRDGRPDDVEHPDRG